MAERNVTVKVRVLDAGSNLAEASKAMRGEITNLASAASAARRLMGSPISVPSSSASRIGDRPSALSGQSVKRSGVDLNEILSRAEGRKAAQAQQAMMAGDMASRKFYAQGVRDNLVEPAGAAMHRTMFSLGQQTIASEAAARRQQIGIETPLIGGASHRGALREEIGRGRAAEMFTAREQSVAASARLVELRSSQAQQEEQSLRKIQLRTQSKIAMEGMEQALISRRTIGSKEHMGALRQEISLRRELSRNANMIRRAELIAEHGSFLGRAAHMDERFSIGDRARNAAFGGAGMIAGAVASNQALSRTLGTNLRIAMGEFSIPFTRQVVAVARGLRTVSDWFRDLSPQTREATASIATLTLGLAATTWVGARAARVVRSVGSTPAGASFLGGQVPTVIGAAGRRLASAATPAVAGYMTGRVLDSAVGPGPVSRAAEYGVYGVAASRLLRVGGRALGPVGMAVGTVMGQREANQQAAAHGQQVAQQTPHIAQAIRDALQPFEGAAFGPQGGNREAALDAVLGRHRLSLEDIGERRGNWAAGGTLTTGNLLWSTSLGQNRIEGIASASQRALRERQASQVGGGRVMGPPSPLDPSRERGIERDELRSRAMSLLDVNFQSRQVGISDLHDIVQQEAVRSPAQQREFEMQTRALHMLVRELSNLSTTQEATNENNERLRTVLQQAEQTLQQNNQILQQLNAMGP